MNKAYIFYHIPKTAGSSIASMLSASFQGTSYGAYNVEQVFDISKINGFQKDIAIYGHAAWGVHDYLQDRFIIQYFTFLRRPWDIFRSSYQYELNLNQYIGDIDSYYRRYRHNLLIEYLGCGDITLAEERLFSYFACYGIKEQFKTSLVHLKRKLCIDLRQNAYVNVSKKQKMEIPSWLKDKFYEQNRYDIEFYEKALHRFCQETNDIQSFEIKDSDTTQLLPKEKKISYSKALVSRNFKTSSAQFVKASLACEQDADWYQQARIMLKMMDEQSLSDEVLKAGFTRFPILFAHNEAARLRRINPKKALTTLQWYVSVLRNYKTNTHDSHINRMISRAKAQLAGIYEDMERGEDAAAVYRSCLISGSDGFDHLCRLITLLRKQSQHEACRSLIIAYENIAADTHASRLKRELSVAYYDMAQAKKAYDLAHQAISDKEHLQVKKDAIIFATCLPMKKGIVVINTAPSIVYDFVLSELIPAETNVTLLSPPHALSRLNQKKHNAVFAMPNGYFNYTNDMNHIDDAVFRIEASAVVIMMSTYDPEGFKEIIKLARIIHAKNIYCYAMDFIFSNNLKRSFVQVE